jgi:hypothetical protein
LSKENKSEIRAAILKRLKQIGMSPFKLSTTQKSVHYNTAQLFLYGTRQLRLCAVEELLELVGLQVVRKDLVEAYLLLEEAAAYQRSVKSKRGQSIADGKYSRAMEMIGRIKREDYAADVEAEPVDIYQKTDFAKALDKQANTSAEAAEESVENNKTAFVSMRVKAEDNLSEKTMKSRSKAAAYKDLREIKKTSKAAKAKKIEKNKKAKASKKARLESSIEKAEGILGDKDGQ